MRNISKYKEDLYQRYWEYHKFYFSNDPNLVEHPSSPDGRPPVFVPSEAWRNIILNPAASQKEKNDLIALVPEGERQKWFRSTSNSQALTQSVFGNLKIYNALHVLSELKDDEGNYLFGRTPIASADFTLEHKVDHLGEPHPTSHDGYISGEYRVAIDCKLSEIGFGTCSRPRLKETALSYARTFCDGTYSIQRSRQERCPLTGIGVRYWQYVPGLFTWKNDADLRPCPLNKNYQLVRNILSIGVRDGTVSPLNGHVVIVYDSRNPAFQFGGEADNVFLETKRALLEPAMLRKCSWQRIVRQMRAKGILSWLTDDLASKYGL